MAVFSFIAAQFTLEKLFILFYSAASGLLRQHRRFQQNFHLEIVAIEKTPCSHSFSHNFVFQANKKNQLQESMFMFTEPDRGDLSAAPFTNAQHQHRKFIYKILLQFSNCFQ